MLNIDKVETVYLAYGYTDLRKNIDGLVMIVQNQFKLNPFDKALFVFCNKQVDKIKILHFDEGFWLYYHHLEKWPTTIEEALKVNIEELRWLLMSLLLILLYLNINMLCRFTGKKVTLI